MTVAVLSSTVPCLQQWPITGGDRGSLRQGQRQREPFNYDGEEVAYKTCIWYMSSLPAWQHAHGTLH